MFDKSTGLYGYAVEVTPSRYKQGQGSREKAVDELEYLVTFNRSISQAMQRTMQDLSEGVFISMANLTLARRDSYLEFIHGGV